MSTSLAHQGYLFFWSPQDVTEEVAVKLVVVYLGVSQGQAQSHVRSYSGLYYKLE